MARPPALSEKEWADVIKRVPPLGKESIRSVAKEKGIAEGTIRRRVNTHEKPIAALANQIARVESEFERLPLKTQVKVRTLADELKGISEHLAWAAHNGAMTAHRLSQIANAQAQKLDDSGSLEENAEALKLVMAMTKGANDSAQIGLNILAANKETVIQINKAAEPDAQPRSRADFYATDA